MILNLCLAPFLRVWRSEMMRRAVLHSLDLLAFPDPLPGPSRCKCWAVSPLTWRRDNGALFVRGGFGAIFAPLPRLQLSTRLCLWTRSASRLGDACQCAHERTRAPRGPARAPCGLLPLCMENQMAVVKGAREELVFTRDFIFGARLLSLTQGKSRDKLFRQHEESLPKIYSGNMLCSANTLGDERNRCFFRSLPRLSKCLCIQGMWTRFHAAAATSVCWITWQPAGNGPDYFTCSFPPSPLVCRRLCVCGP